MSKTLLAVDDSATMRKVLEITFSGEDFRVVTADNTQNALSKLSEEPSVVVVDTSLGGEDAYALAKEIRKRAPATTVVLMASKHGPYDAAKGKDSGADDFVDKPFDTQQMIDKVRKAMLARESGGAPAAKPAAAAPAAAAPTSTVPSIQSPFQPAAATRPQTPAAPPVAAAPAQRAPVAQPRNATLSFEGNIPRSPAAASAPAATASAAKPTASASVGASVNGQLAGKLGELGLTAQQADAVLALSREVVERVVWEVVPQLAEALIKEEIARLTKEG